MILRFSNLLMGLAIVGSQFWVVARVIDEDEELAPIAQKIDDLAQRGRDQTCLIAGAFTVTQRPLCPSASRIRATLASLPSSSVHMDPGHATAAAVLPALEPSTQLAWVQKRARSVGLGDELADLSPLTVDYLSWFLAMNSIALLAMGFTWRWKARALHCGLGLFLVTLSVATLGWLLYEGSTRAGSLAGVSPPEWVEFQWIACAGLALISLSAVLIGRSAPSSIADGVEEL